MSSIIFFFLMNFRSARQKPPRKANGSTLSTHADANNPFFDDKIEDQSLHGLEGEDGGHECKPREDIVLPEWLVELPEDLEVSVLYYSSIFFLESLKKDFFLSVSSTSILFLYIFLFLLFIGNFNKATNNLT